VPGPPYPLHLLGHKMLRWYPYVPVGGEMAMNCAVLSYDGNIGFGFSGDVHAVPDLRRLEELLKVSFAELREAAGMPPSHDEKRRSRKQQATSAVTASVFRPRKNGSIPQTMRPLSGEPGQSSVSGGEQQGVSQMVA